MNNGNSSKQVLLSVLGIAILVVAVVGVSFAFFTYSKAGEKNNVITTGQIFFDFTETGDAIVLTNQFPMTKTQGKTLSVDNSSYDTDHSTWESCIETAAEDVQKKAACGHEPQKNNDVLAFTITGYNESTKPIDYTITAVEGTAPSYENDVVRTKMNDSAIMLYLTGDKSSALPNGATSDFNTDAALVSSKGTLSDGIEIGKGQIKANTSQSSQQTDKFELRMWINGEKGGVEIVNADEEDTAQNKYSADSFAKLYYALKVKVDANTPAVQ